LTADVTGRIRRQEAAGRRDMLGFSRTLRRYFNQ